MSKETLRLALEALTKVDALCPVGSNEEIYVRDAIYAITEALAKQEQGEPVAWMRQDGQRVTTASDRHNYPDYETRYSIPLYTTPQQSKPLTDEMAKQMKERCDSMEMRGAFADGWVSAEAAHGIKE